MSNRRTCPRRNMSVKPRLTVHFEDELDGHNNHSYQHTPEANKAACISSHKYCTNIMEHTNRAHSNHTSVSPVIDNKELDLRVDSDGISAMSKSRASSAKTFCVKFTVDDLSDVASLTNGHSRHSGSNEVHPAESSRHDGRHVNLSNDHGTLLESPGNHEHSLKSSKHHRHSKTLEPRANHEHSLKSSNHHKHHETPESPGKHEHSLKSSNHHKHRETPEPPGKNEHSLKSSNHHKHHKTPEPPGKHEHSIKSSNHHKHHEIPESPGKHEHSIKSSNHHKHHKTPESPGKHEHSLKSSKHHKRHKAPDSSNYKHSPKFSRNHGRIVPSPELDAPPKASETTFVPPASPSSNSASFRQPSIPFTSASSVSSSSTLASSPSPTATPSSNSVASTSSASSTSPSATSFSTPGQFCRPKPTRPSSEFKQNLAQLVNELIHKVLNSQPDNIPAFCADYLDQKIQARSIEEESQEHLSSNSPTTKTDSYAEQASKVRQSQHSKEKHSEVQRASANQSSIITNQPECTAKQPKSSTKQSNGTTKGSLCVPKQPIHSTKAFTCTRKQPTCSSHQYTCTPNQCTCTTTRLGEVVTDSAAVAGVMSGLSTQTPELGDSLSGVMKSLQLKPSHKADNLLPQAPITKTDSVHFKVPKNPHLMTLSGQHEAQVTQMELIGDWIITCSLDKTIGIWSSFSGNKVVEHTCPKPATNCVLLPSKGRKKWTLLVAMDDGKVAALLVKLGKRASIKPLEEFHMHHPNPIRAMVVSSDGRSLATGCCFSMPLLRHSKVIGTTHRGTLKTWDLEEMLDHLEEEGPNRSYECSHVALRTSRQLVSGNTNYNMIPSYDRFTNKSTDSSLYFGIGAIAYSPDNSVIAVGLAGPEDSPRSSPPIGHRKMLVLCAAGSLDTLWVQRDPYYEVTSLGFCPGDGGSVEYPWDLFVGTNQTLATLRISPKGGKGGKSEVNVDHLWQKEFDEFHSGGHVTPDGRLACAGLGTTIHVFESSSNNQVATYDGGHRSQITRVNVSGHVILSADLEGVVCVWKIPKKTRGSVPAV